MPPVTWEVARDATGGVPTSFLGYAWRPGNLDAAILQRMEVCLAGRNRRQHLDSQMPRDGRPTKLFFPAGWVAAHTHCLGFTDQKATRLQEIEVLCKCSLEGLSSDVDWRFPKLCDASTNKATYR